MKHTPGEDRFETYVVAVELCRALRSVLAAIGQADADLGKQLRRAASSVPLNVAEARRRAGRDRAHLFRVAAGSTAEVRAALEVAAAWGYVDGAAVADALALCDRLLAMLWRLAPQRRRR